ncbi:MAG: dynamin family protein [Clostridium sp.]
MDNVENVYSEFKDKQKYIASLIKKASEQVKLLNMNQYNKILCELSEKVENDTFRIQIVGTFKNGKSTFINSFLGEEILPAEATPCTAVINEVKYGEKKGAILYFKDEMPEKLPSNIPEDIKHHMEKYKENIPPIEIKYDEIEKFVVIPMGKDPSEMLLESPYEKVELFYPLDLLKNGVEIIDSPGLNEHSTRTRVTLGYLSKADAVLFILKADALCSADEMEFIDKNLIERGFSDIYYIINKFDVIRKKEQDKIKDFAKFKLKDKTSFGEEGLFFVSALNALDGKLENDEELYNNSGMKEFEEELSKYLVENKGKIKLLQPAKELKRIINKEVLSKTIPQQRNMLDKSLDELNLAYKDAIPKFDALKDKKNDIKNKLEKGKNNVSRRVEKALSQFYKDLPKQVAGWVEEYECENKIEMLHPKQSTSNLTEEITNMISVKIDKHYEQWSEEVLTDIIEDGVSNMLSSVENELESFFIDLDKITIDINNEDVEVETIPVWQRIAGICGGLLIGDVGIAAVGGVSGISKQFVKGIAIQLASYALLGFLGFLNPATIIAVILGSVISSSHSTKKDLEKKIKEKIVEECNEKITKDGKEKQEDFIKSIDDKFDEFINNTINSMETEINEARNQIELILKNLKEGEDEVNKKKEIISECEQEITSISSKLDDFVSELCGF